MGFLAESELQKMSFLTVQGCILVIAMTYIISVIIIFFLFVTISRYLKKKKTPHYVALGELLTLFNSSFNTDILDFLQYRDWHFYIKKKIELFQWIIWSLMLNIQSLFIKETNLWQCSLLWSFIT